MTYYPEEVAEIVRSHHQYIEGLKTHVRAFPKDRWMDEGRFEFLHSDRYRELTRTYEDRVPGNVRQLIEPEVNFFLKRILNPRDESDPRLPTNYRSPREVLEGRKLPRHLSGEKGTDDGND
jgi:hypothetical protein